MTPLFGQHDTILVAGNDQDTSNSSLACCQYIRLETYPFQASSGLSKRYRSIIIYFTPHYMMIALKYTVFFFEDLWNLTSNRRSFALQSTKEQVHILLRHSLKNFRYFSSYKYSSKHYTHQTLCKNRVF